MCSFYSGLVDVVLVVVVVLVVDAFDFFTPIPCTYTSLPLDGMARNYYFLSTWICRICRITRFIMSGSIFSYLLIPEERRKNIWSEGASNPSPLASQATALTTRTWLLGR